MEYLKAKESAKENEELPRAEEFTEKDAEKRQKLILQGWPGWNKKDFFNFVRMGEKYGRDAGGNFENFREALHLKLADEIENYSAAFWKNYASIENGHKYVERIVKGEAEIEKRNNMDMSIRLKFE